jgi:hypothetical protein
MIDLTWIRYFFHLNLTDNRDVVDDFVAGDVITEESGVLLALALNEKDKKEGKGHWNAEANTNEWSLVGATVAYNGPNSLDYPTKGTMGFVLILDFPESSVKPQGRMYLPYNSGV